MLKTLKLLQADVNIEKVAKEIDAVKNYGGRQATLYEKNSIVDNPNAVMRIMNWVLSNKSWNLANKRNMD